MVASSRSANFSTTVVLPTPITPSTAMKWKGISPASPAGGGAALPRGPGTDAAARARSCPGADARPWARSRPGVRARTAARAGGGGGGAGGGGTAPDPRGGGGGGGGGGAGARRLLLAVGERVDVDRGGAVADVPHPPHRPLYVQAGREQLLGGERGLPLQNRVQEP